MPEAEELAAEIIELSAEANCTLLHSFALLFSWRLLAGPIRPGGKQRLEEKKQWIKLIASCIHKDYQSLHRLESVRSWAYGYSEASPLSSIMWSLIGRKNYVNFDTRRCSRRHGRRHAKRLARRLVTALGSILIAWIAMLSDCGVDLLSYGRQERRLHERGSTGYRQRWYAGNLAETARISLIGITYGSRPEQWRLWWTWEYEDYVGEFWDSVESQAYKLPGSWVDDPWDRDDFESEEDDRLERWEREETMPWVWSEYRKIRPPI
ncbi:hypothetical protein LZ30DRAFT_714616 [Colletotrichum cereale]|nr:hypothetical protein LZ30DRAFT_714616 [Colletotrichum cereale]